MGVVNDEMNNCGGNLNGHGCFLNEPNGTRLSCVFIDNLRERGVSLVKKTASSGADYDWRFYFQTDYANLTSGDAALNASRIRGLIYFASNYTRALKNRLNLLLMANRYDVDASSVQITLDPTSKRTRRRTLRAFIRSSIVRFV